ncbi:unnamed protein product [Linum tenue]|nr:unnamed protein product [Linum tenue]CAI0459065.1 unnamed protein product [Linum tenue]
MLRRSA